MNQSACYPICCATCKYNSYEPNREPCRICRWDKVKKQGTEFKKGENDDR